MMYLGPLQALAVIWMAQMPCQLVTSGDKIMTWMSHIGKLEYLRKDEEATLRKCVYSGAFITAVAFEGECVGSEVAGVPEELVSIYRRNRPSTIRLLLSIVEGGRPQDARLAAVFAISLLESPAAGAMIGASRLDEFDKVGVNGATYRDFCLSAISAIKRRGLETGGK